jgi:predicted O-methyltransferase YrrM
MDISLRSILQELHQFGQDHDPRTTERWQKMLNITPETGELLAILVLSTKAKRVVEIGTSNGYSTLWLADAVREIAGNVVTVEFAAAKAELARQNFERAGLSAWIRQNVMDAGEFIRREAAESADLVFLDTDRKQYLAWWPAIERLVAPGGLLVVDNAISHPAELEAFIAEVLSAPGWRSVVVPVGNGEFIALKSMHSS